VFRRFRLAGEVSNVGQFLMGAANADIRPVQRSGRRRDELPLQASVERFPR
jgi:hypothetical protein